MGLMDKAKQAVKGRSGQIERGVDQAAKMVDKRTGGKYRDKVAKGAGQLKAKARTLDEDRRDQAAGTDPMHGSDERSSGGMTGPAGEQEGSFPTGHGVSSAPQPTAASDPPPGSAHLGDHDQHDDPPRQP